MFFSYLLSENMCPKVIDSVSKYTMTSFVFKTGPTPLKCYNGGSFYVFLRNTFLSFGFPDLSTFTSLLPQTRKSEVIHKTSYLKPFLKFMQMQRLKYTLVFKSWINTVSLNL